MAYPDGEVPTTERVHPTPIYETLAGLVFFAILWRLRDRLAPHRLFGLYLLLSGAARFLVELIRLNDEIVVGLTQPQLFAAAFALVGAALLAWRRQAAAPAPQPAVADMPTARRDGWARRAATSPSASTMLHRRSRSSYKGEHRWKALSSHSRFWPAP